MTYELKDWLNSINQTKKNLIDEEVENVFNEMNLNSQWLYGQNRPTRSRKGYTHQGSFLPGLGFKR